MFKILENNLNDNDYDNHIYFGLNSDEINNLHQLLKNDYGCLDIVINFNDMNKLDNLIKCIPNNLDQNLIKKYIYQHYLYYKILSFIEEDINLKNVLFGGNINEFRDYKFVMFSSVLKKLELFAQNKRIRLHFFVDEYNNKYLQQQINDLIYMRISIAVRCYTVNDNLTTYLTSDGNMLESPHDYSDFHTKEFYQKLKTKNIFE